MTVIVRENSTKHVYKHIDVISIHTQEEFNGVEFEKVVRILCKNSFVYRYKHNDYTLMSIEGK